MRVVLEIELPDALGVELESAARRCGIAPPMWAAQTIESELASQRLPAIKLGRCGPRVVESEFALREHNLLVPDDE